MPYSWVCWGPFAPCFSGIRGGAKEADTMREEVFKGALCDLQNASLYWSQQGNSHHWGITREKGRWGCAARTSKAMHNLLQDLA